NVGRARLRSRRDETICAAVRGDPGVAADRAGSVPQHERAAVPQRPGGRLCRGGRRCAFVRRRVLAPRQNHARDRNCGERRGYGGSREQRGPYFNRWYVFYDDVRRPMSSAFIGQLCVIGLPDGRILIKQVQRGTREGLYNLHSATEKTITDATIEWA